MPNESGIEFITKLRASKNLKLQTIPAVALTAYVRQEEVDAALAAGFQAHVGKPVSTPLLMATIHQVLKSESANATPVL